MSSPDENRPVPLQEAPTRLERVCPACGMILRIPSFSRAFVDEPIVARCEFCTWVGMAVFYSLLSGGSR
jgi:hypothetical protein